MPPSASARPPIHTTHRVPKRSSKPIGAAPNGKAGDAGAGGTDVGCGGDGAGGDGVGGGGGSTGAAACGGGGAGCGSVCTGETPAGARWRSNASTLGSRRCSKLPSSSTLTSATMAITGKASASATSTITRWNTEAPTAKSP